MTPDPLVTSALSHHSSDLWETSLLIGSCVLVMVITIAALYRINHLDPYGGATNSVSLLKQRIKTDPVFAEGLHHIHTTAEASRFCKDHGIWIRPEKLWTQRGKLFSDGLPCWPG
tara:strand:- start:1944 stop:2288 length:345 start_codon:yes stop_codon:yes gene_type:complete